MRVSGSMWDLVGNDRFVTIACAVGGCDRSVSIVWVEGRGFIWNSGLDVDPWVGFFYLRA